MSVIQVDRIGEPRTINLNNNNDGEVVLGFRVRTNDPTDGQAVVLTATNAFSNGPGGTMSIPPPWADLTSASYNWLSSAERTAITKLLPLQDAACKCIRRKAKQTDNANVWEVTCTFSTSNPLSIPIKVTFHDEITKLAVDVDVKGRLIRNSAGDPWNNPIAVETNLLRIHVVKNFQNYDPFLEAKLMASLAAGTALAASLDGLDGAAAIITGLGAAAILAETLAGIQSVSSCVNDKEWWGFPKGTVRYRPGGGEWINDLDQPAPYFRREYDFLINPNGWAEQRLDCGYSCFVTSNGMTIKKTVTEAGHRKSAPTLLDGKGFQLATDSTGKYTGVPVYLSFPIYPERDFGQLGLPTKAPWL